MPRLPDAYAPRPVPQSNRGIVTYDGTAVARATSQMGAEVYQLGDQLSREEAVQEALGARRQMDDWERAFRAEATQKKGKDSFGLDAAASFDNSVGKIGETLSNPRAKRAFQEMAVARRAQVLDWTNSYITREREAYNLGEHNANVEGFIQNAASDPKRAVTESQMMTDTIKNFWRGRGMSSAEVDLRVNTATDALHEGVVKGLMADPATAMDGKAYFDKVSSSITNPKVRAALEKEVRVVSDAIEVTKGTQELWDAYGPKGPNDEVALFELEKKAREKYANDPVKQRDAISSIRNMTTAWDKQQSGRVANLTIELMDSYQKGARNLKVLPAYQALPSTEQVKIDTFLKNEAYTASIRAVADLNRQEQLIRLNEAKLERDTADKYLQYSDVTKLGDMSVDEVRALLPVLGVRRTEHLLGVRQQLEAKTGKLVVRQDQETFNRLADSAGFKPFDPTKTEKQRRELGLLKDAVDQGISVFQTTNKREATYEEKRQLMQEIIDNKVMVDINWGRDLSKPLAMLTPDELKNAYVTVGDKEIKLSDIPPEFIVKTMRKLKADGFPVTQQNIAEAYVRSNGKRISTGVVNGR
jgi:hypothetical protein